MPGMAWPMVMRHPIAQKRQLLSESYPSPRKSHIYRSIFSFAASNSSIVHNHQSDIMMKAAG
jgi:hypothetical protein